MKDKKLILTFIGSILLGVGLVSCGKDELIDYVSQVHLDSSLTYTNVSFKAKSIGQVNLKSGVDGDTAHFYQTTDNSLIKARFIGIDTPESTGIIQPWGKAASKFTTSKLEAAKTIVLTADTKDIGKAAEFDSTGSRYKTLVWISEKENCPINELKCLNLWIVQEGYSTSKGLDGSSLASYFYDADKQAQDHKLHIWSDDPDPDFYDGNATKTSLKELMEDYAAGNEDKWNGAKVNFTAVVIKPSQANAYLAETFEEEDNQGNITYKTYGCFVFTQYRYYDPLTVAGNRIEITGVWQYRFGAPQLCDVSYSEYWPEDDDMKLLQTDQEVNIPNYTVDELYGLSDTEKGKLVNRIFTVNNLVGVSGYNDKDGDTETASMTIRCSQEGSTNKLNLRISDDVHVKNSSAITITKYTDFVGKTFNVTGAFVKYTSTAGNTSYQLSLCSNKDFTFVN